MVTAHTIGDVASVKITDDPSTSISRVDGKPALTIAVTKLPSANTVEVSRAVNKIVPDLQDKIDGTRIEGANGADITSCGPGSPPQ